MATKSNTISILRKRVVNNIPGFDDDETGNPQNDWIKLYDIKCVDFAPANTARVYDFEHAPNYKNNNTTYYTDFYFESTRQPISPPYDIQVGDYVAYYQQGNKYYHRIVRVMDTQIFVACCIHELTCAITNPREVKTLNSCGILSSIPDEEVPGFITEGEDNE